MKYILYTVFVLLIHNAKGQYAINGVVTDNAREPLSYATVALLNPADSTLLFFGISDDDGKFEIKSVREGNYLLQASFIGYKSLYIAAGIPNPGIADSIILQPLDHSLTEVSISAERSPISIRNDTIEYNAGSFKTTPDAVAEDLLKKLPGVEVDRDGNIKAQGEIVTNVLVDGKEFFSNDPKVATRNLPADALESVQVFDKKSEQAELTGIDDGEREKTINLLLKSNRKSAYFGDVLAGAGTGEHYKASGRFYRFTKEKQLAFLGMINNINQYGFSFRDFMDFSGGMKNMMSGEGNAELNADNSIPVNFGRPVNGLAVSGAGGINYTYEPVKNKRFNISYLLTGADREKEENIYTENYSDSITFFSDTKNNSENVNRKHGLNINWKNKVDSMQALNFNGSFEFGNTTGNSGSYTLLKRAILNESESFDTGNEKGLNLSGRGRASYIKKFEGKWPVLRFSAEANVNRSETESHWNNTVNYFENDSLEAQDRFRNDNGNTSSYTATVSTLRKAGKHQYIEPAVEAGYSIHSIKREEGNIGTEEEVNTIDFTSYYKWIRPSLAFKYNYKKRNFLAGTKFEILTLYNDLEDTTSFSKDYYYLLPRMNYEYEYKKGRRFGINYTTRLNQPPASYLLPVVNNRNPLEIRFGNPALKPEYQHSLRLNWRMFDQFTMTSFFANLYGRYTKDKINWSSVISNELVQETTPVNTDDDYMADASVEVATPVRAAGIKVSIDAGETYNRAIRPVNHINNITTQFSHHFGVRIDNRKKDKLDAAAGINVRLTSTGFTLKELANEYIKIDYYSEITYRFGERSLFGITADIATYSGKSFGNRVAVPLLNAFITQYFLSSGRLSATVEGFDILNENSGIERISELNYLKETQSSIIGRYIMLTLKYRLNKFQPEEKVKVDVK